MNERRRFVAGVDGCKGGWVVVLLELNGDRRVVGESCRVVDAFHNIIVLPEAPRFVAVDIPIGLPTVAMPGGRACDREARQMLGKRGTSVFSPPVRAVLSADCYEKAVALSRASSRHTIGITKQVYGLVPKLREVHDAMTPDAELHHDERRRAARFIQAFGKRQDTATGAPRAALLRCRRRAGSVAQIRRAGFDRCLRRRLERLAHGAGEGALHPGRAADGFAGTADGDLVLSNAP